MKRTVILAVISVAAIAQQSTIAVAAQALYSYCDPRELVRLAGEVVGDPNPVASSSFQCLSTIKVCKLQADAVEATAQADLMFRLAAMVKVCRAAGY